MKTHITVVITVLAVFLVAFTYAQDKCKVLVPELSGTYVGKCKKGLANGKGKAVGTDNYEGNFRKGLPNGGGVYTWANGDVYDGRWVFGVRDGEGVFKFKYDGIDSIQEGVWKEDEYIGPKPKRPRLITKRNIDKYTFRKISGNQNQIIVRLYQGGNDNIVERYSIFGSSGTSYDCANCQCLEGIDFPVTVKIQYITLNKARTLHLDASIEFEIFEEGTWEVLLYN